MSERDPDSSPVHATPVAPRIAELLAAIEAEPVPERLLELARELQEALRCADESPKSA